MIKVNHLLFKNYVDAVWDRITPAPLSLLHCTPQIPWFLLQIPLMINILNFNFNYEHFLILTTIQYDLIMRMFMVLRLQRVAAIMTDGRLFEPRIFRNKTFCN